MLFSENIKAWLNPQINKMGCVDNSCFGSIIQFVLKLKKTLLSQPFQVWSYPLVSFVLLIFLAMSVLYWRGEGNFLTASYEQIFSQHQYWKLFTTIGVHADVKHFLGNSIFFFIFAFLLHSYFGLIWFPLLSLLLGAIVNYFTLALYPPGSTLLGASGVVYLMAGAWAALFVLIERKSPVLKRIMAAAGVSLILFFPSQYEPEISYLAHSLGFLLGVVSASFYFYGFRNSIRAKEVWVETEPELPPELSDFFSEIS